MAEKEFGDKKGIRGFLTHIENSKHKNLFVGIVLNHLIYMEDLPVLAADQIRKELVIHFRQSR